MQLGPSAAGPEWVITDAASMRAFSRERRARNQKVAFVPTMGSLHEGHLSLVRHAKARAPIVVVSIYVNPTQFAPTEDFEEYPRQIKEDLRKLKEEGGVSAVFMPKDLYAPRNNGDRGTESSESEAGPRTTTGRSFHERPPDLGLGVQTGAASMRQDPPQILQGRGHCGVQALQHRGA